jgi:glycosyltransferase involved in cell wall biosynthesis
MTPKRILFYSSVATKKQFSYQEFYRTDIHILRELGYRVILSNSFLDFFCFWKYDIAFIYFYRYGLIPAFLARLSGKRVYFTGGIDFLDKSFVGRRTYLLQKLLFFLCYIFSTRSIIVSRADRFNIEQGFRWMKFGKLAFSNHVINFDLYHRPEIHPREKFFTTIAWMKLVINVKRKGVDKSVYLFNELLKYPLFADYRLYIIGPTGKGSEMVESIIDTLDLKGKVILTGMLTEQEKVDFLKRGRYYLQLSEYEGFGIAVIEAMAAGNIVIHTGKGGLKDAVGKHGQLVSGLATEYAETARRIHECLSEMTDAQYQSVVEKGIEHVRTHFNYDRRKEDFKKIIG